MLNIQCVLNPPLSGAVFIVISTPPTAVVPSMPTYP